MPFLGINSNEPWFLEEEESHLVGKGMFNKIARIYFKNGQDQETNVQSNFTHLFLEAHDQPDMLLVNGNHISRLPMFPQLGRQTAAVLHLPLGNFATIRNAAYDRDAEKIYMFGDMSNSTDDVFWSINAVDGSGLTQHAFVPSNLGVTSPLVLDGIMYYTDGENNLWSINPSPVFLNYSPTLVCSDCVGNTLICDDQPFYQRGDFDLGFDVDITDFNTLADNFDPLGLNVVLWANGDMDEDWDVGISDEKIPKAAIEWCLVGIVASGLSTRCSRNVKDRWGSAIGCTFQPPRRC